MDHDVVLNEIRIAAANRNEADRTLKRLLARASRGGVTGRAIALAIDRSGAAAHRTIRIALATYPPDAAAEPTPCPTCGQVETAS